MTASATNKFGRLADLGNEATVEQFFVSRLLTDLGYQDAQVRPKASLDELTVNLGRRRVRYRPDFALLVDRQIRWICEAKGVEEDLDTWVGQCSSYCLELNRTQTGNPVEFFMLTNGVQTRVYRWDQAEPLLEAEFHHFVEGNDRYDHLQAMLGHDALRASAAPAPPDVLRLTLRRKSVSDLNVDFAWAHRLIYKRESLSYTAAFMEFVKVVFLKLLSDRQVHESVNLQTHDNGVSVPRDEVRFSRRWIEAREQDTPNPLDAILFQQLLQDFETEIRSGSKKRIFREGERLDLSADTIKSLVERFQNIDLISIDADLNGRMFETFLNSTLRGKALGQYFTPRSVVKLATGLSQLEATPTHVDRVVDACCGTGGFLIEALAVMWNQIEANAALTNVEKEELRTQVATQSLFGVDVARDPALARIARINMYLHGDGGSSIYQVDALDKRTRLVANDNAEMRREKAELRQRIAEGTRNGGFADVALTNPPFAKDYSRDSAAEEQLLDDYELAFSHVGATRRPLATVSSMVLFLERYHDLLRPGGRLVTVIDDGLLGGPRRQSLRNWLRSRWIIKAVVSLPGDAFQRSQARVKTSVVVLEKRFDEHQEQPAAFMYYCTAVGVDDAPRQRVLPIDEENRRLAEEEILTVARLFAAFRDGRPEATPWIVPAEGLTDRLDVKACLPQAGRRVAEWAERGYQVRPLSEFIAPLDLDSTDAGRAIDASGDDGDLVTYLRVRYDGFSESGDEVWTSDIGATSLVRVEENDVVISHINAVHGAVAVIPPEHAGHVVTSEYTVCRTLPGVDPRLIWTLMRSPEARADLLLLATGIGRTRVHWEQASLLLLPVPPDELVATVVGSLEEADQAERSARSLREGTRELVETTLALESDTARAIIAAFKPPR